MIVVAGGGIAGLASALALAPLGDILVLERREALASNEGAGIQLAPNAIKALRALGVEARVRAVAHRPGALQVLSGARHVVRVPYDSAFESRFGAPSLTIARAVLHRALLDAALEHPRVTLVADRAVERARLTQEGWVVPGPGGAAEGVRWLVAADGVNSAVRRDILGDAPHDTGWVAWRGRSTGPADAEAGPSAGPGPGEEPRTNETTLTMAPGCHLVRYPISDAAAASANLVYVERAGGDAPGGATGVPVAAQDWVPWPIRTREPHVYRSQSLAFVGDAAHAMRPFLAQGAAMALEDAAVLGLAAARYGTTDDALEAYERARAKRVRRVADLSTRQGQIYHMAAPFSHARDLAMTRLGPRAIGARIAFVYDYTPAVDT